MLLSDSSQDTYSTGGQPFFTCGEIYGLALRKARADPSAPSKGAPPVRRITSGQRLRPLAPIVRPGLAAWLGGFAARAKLPGTIKRAPVEGTEEVTVVVQPAIKEQILNDLNRLSPEQQKRAADLVHGLVSPLPKGASVEDLMKVAGTLDDESAREMMAAIEEGCERVDLDEW